MKNKLIEPIEEKEVDLPLPDFLFEDEGEIKIGFHGDTVVTDEWNKWKSKLVRNPTEKQVYSALDWFYDKIKSHFEHDGDALETLNFTYAIAKQKERDSNV